MTENQLQALRLFAHHTGYHFTFFQLTGPVKANYRAEMLSLLLGERVPKNKAGINVLEKAFYDLAKPQGDCAASRERNFGEWAKAQLLEANAQKWTEKLNQVQQ